MKRPLAAVLLGLTFVGCSSGTGASTGATGGSTGATGGMTATAGSGGAPSTPAGGGTGTASTPAFPRSECGSLAASDLEPGTSAAGATAFVTGQLVGGRVDPNSPSNQEHHWAIQLAAGFYHLVLDARTANGDLGNVGINVSRVVAGGDETQLVHGNEIARRYRDEAFFEVKSAELVPLKVTSNFGVEDYVMGVFPNGTAVPSPAFDHCPTVTPLTVGQAASFVLGGSGTAGEEQWFAVDLPLGNYKFTADATQAADQNLGYDLDTLDRFGQEPRATNVIWANDIGVHSTKQGTLAVGEATSFWVRLRNSFAGDLSVTLTVSAP